jgi:hypothetical protein
MIRRAFAVSLGVALGVVTLVGCGSGTAAVMPDVVGRTLEVALSDIERAGYQGRPEVLGGGVFGVVDESNWQVCEQMPAAGQAVAEKPRLTVDRSCGGEPTEAPANTDTPSDDDSEEATSDPAEEATDEAAAQEEMIGTMTESDYDAAIAAMSRSRQEAVEAAASYLDSGHFSKTGLTQQLSSEYGEGFARKDAKFAVQFVEDLFTTRLWKAEAAEAAESYLESGHFSRTELIDQLTSQYGEGFTQAQATYGVKKSGL